MDDDRTIYNWIAISGKKIALAGANDDYPEAERVIDLNDKTMLPGLADCHVHVLTAGMLADAVDLSGVTSLKDVFDRIEEECLDSKGKDWIVGANFIPTALYDKNERRYPNRWELDEISHGHKVIIIAATLHGVSVNTKAMEYIDIPYTVPGVEKKKGELSGIYSADESAFGAIAKYVGSLSDEEQWGFIRKCVDTAVKTGCTTMHGLLGMFGDSDRDVDLIVERKDTLPLTMVEYYQTWDVDKVLQIGWPRIGGCITLDGALFEHTICEFEPFEDVSSKRGLLYHSDIEVFDFVRKAHRHGLQVAVHALGARAIDQLINIYRQVIMEEDNNDRSNRLRHRIEHFATATPEQIKMAKDFNIILSMQVGDTIWDAEEGGEFEITLGRKRADGWNPMKQIVEEGNMVISGSDAPVVDIDLMRDLVLLVDNPNPKRNVSVDEALCEMTRNAAYSAFLEKEKGTIEVGKDADLCVISANPYETAGACDFNRIHNLMTVHEGKIVYEAQV